MKAVKARVARFMVRKGDKFRNMRMLMCARVCVCSRSDCMVRSPRGAGWSETGVSILCVSFRDCVYLGICVSCFWM